ncbi:CDP-alcohol phosphatidyltransferase family protein [Curtobacterium sp. S6]|uniref:CDP-alcohol phosphatidyltransferase family protein n=1 Tax=Curtobacterium sp. S6 TaxID=1479623 RepID=UPI00068C8785|nr:CDP-alcohol phosphatidyltransferase family protein [Curtobacterium sp. S6]
MSDASSHGHSTSPTPDPSPSAPWEATGTDRRAIPQRTTGWAARTADLLHSTGLTPNQVSVGSVIFAAIGALALVLSGTVEHDGARSVWLIMTVVCIPLRLLLNMLDGMLAVEKGMHSPTGDLFNEVPDRVADVLLLAAAGYATRGLWAVDAGLDWGLFFGWSAAVLALMTAYMRTLGAANGVGNFFQGPMAKPRRMWVLVVACLLSLFEPLFGMRGLFLALALVLIAVGAAVTVGMRWWFVSRALERKAAPDAAASSSRTRGPA